MTYDKGIQAVEKSRIVTTVSQYTKIFKLMFFKNHDVQYFLEKSVLFIYDWEYSFTKITIVKGMSQLKVNKVFSYYFQEKTHLFMLIQLDLIMSLRTQMMLTQLVEM